MFSYFKQKLQDRHLGKLIERVTESPETLKQIIDAQNHTRGIGGRDVYPTSEPTDYAWIVGGNEPDLPEIEQFSHGNFALLGCGCLKSIEAAFRQIDFKQYQYSTDGYTNIPKLFIADTSLRLALVWKRLKKQVSKFDTLDDFIQSLQDDKFFEGLTDKSLIDVKLRFINRTLSFCKSDEDYLLMKHMVQKASFMQIDWRSPELYDFIQAHNTRPLVVYASNIHECLSSDIGVEGVEQLIGQIVSIQPCLTLYTSTSLAQSKKFRGDIKPDRVDVLEHPNYDVHRAQVFQNDSVLHIREIFEQYPKKEDYLNEVTKLLINLKIP